jgi:hypothetical protein
MIPELFIIKNSEFTFVSFSSYHSLGTCEGENKIVSHHLIFHTMQFQNRCKCLKIKEDLLYDKSPTVPAWIIFSSTTAASFKSQDSYITSTF